MRPTKADLERARGGQVPDLIAADLRVLLCGINPSLWSVVVGHHFARPGNRFWHALHDSGLTDRLLAPHEEHELLTHDIGVTNISSFGTARADELTSTQLADGHAQLVAKLERYRPRVLAVLGITAYRQAFGEPKAQLGLQERRIGDTDVWVLPNPSGLNAHHQRQDLARLFGELAAYLRSITDGVR